MICIKLMSGEQLPDSDQSKGFRVVVPNEKNFEFMKSDDSGKCYLVLSPDYMDDDFDPKDIVESSKVYELDGNAYVMQSGKTIACYKVNDF